MSELKLIVTDLENFDFKVDGEYRLIGPDSGIKNCIGCFGCWNKTPGKCVIKDAFQNMGIYISQSDELIIISECVYGSLSPFVKSAVDRGISYVQPDFVMVNGEMHHKPRYSNHVELSAYFYGKDMTDNEKQTAKNLMQANMVNFYGKVKTVEFFETAKDMEGIVL